MKRNYNLILLTPLIILLTSNNIYGQKTINELGYIVFNAFKNDSIENICKLTPNSKQLEKFMDSLGIDRSSLSITNIDEMIKESRET